MNRATCCQIWQPQSVNLRKSIMTTSAKSSLCKSELGGRDVCSHMMTTSAIFSTYCRSLMGLASNLVADLTLCWFRTFALTSVGTTTRTAQRSALYCAMLHYVALQRIGFGLLERETSTTLDTGTCHWRGGLHRLVVGVTMPACLFLCNIHIAAMER